MASIEHMFEGQVGGAVEVDDFDPFADRMPLADFPDDDAIDWDAWQAEMEARDPGSPDPQFARQLSADELLVRAATEPPLQSAVTLAQIAPHSLDDDGKLALAAAFTRLENAAAAGKLAAVGAFAGPAPRDDRGEAAFAWAEVAAALALGDG